MDEIEFCPWKNFTILSLVKNVRNFFLHHWNLSKSIAPFESQRFRKNGLLPTFGHFFETQKSPTQFLSQSMKNVQSPWSQPLQKLVNEFRTKNSEIWSYFHWLVYFRSSISISFSFCVFIFSVVTFGFHCGFIFLRSFFMCTLHTTYITMYFVPLEQSLAVLTSSSPF